MAVNIQTTTTVGEAQQAMNADSGAAFFGGGTMLMCMVNYGDQRLSKLVRCSDPALTEIRTDGDRVRIGAGVTMAQILANRDLAYLSAAARSVGGPAIRSAATVGGNLFADAPYGDFATALLALGANVEQAGGGSVAIDDFLRDRERHKGKLLTAVSVPRVASADSLRFLKVTRVRPKGAAVMTMAAFLPRSGGSIEGFRVAYGNMGPTPLRATSVERALEGASMSDAGIAPALAAACDGIEPPTDALASSWYRREVAPIHLKRLLLDRMH